MPGIASKPIRTVLRWQALVTLVCAAAGGWLAGVHGAGSALAGGGVTLLAGLAFAWLIGRSKAATAAGTLFTALKAEGAKILVIVVGLWVVFKTYEQLVTVAFLCTFFATALIFSAAFFVRDGDRVGGSSDGR
ncbi:MAG: F0F1 ATP synthase subunit I [Proteobacteria bacterium]|nr:MAG: F0F1 ATP synthase subunit I [Pseudomonadota bacterium]